MSLFSSQNCLFIVIFSISYSLELFLLLRPLTCSTIIISLCFITTKIALVSSISSFVTVIFSISTNLCSIYSIYCSIQNFNDPVFGSIIFVLFFLAIIFYTQAE